MPQDKSEHQIEVEAKVHEFQNRRREWLRLQGIEFEVLEDESKGDVAAPAAFPKKKDFSSNL
jgi:hypothetical protein